MSGRSAFLATLAIILASPMVITAAATETLQVTELRMENVPLYEKRESGKFEKVDVAKKVSFKGPWTVNNTDGQKFEVTVEGKTYWVPIYAVQTNKPFRVPAECGAVVTHSATKYGAVRGLGEECTK